MILDQALALAARGWPVFPCHPATKQPLVKSDVEGEGGVKLATTDEARIREWWKRWPQAMIGLPTGRAIGAFVVDIDAGEDKKTGEIFEAATLQMNLEAAIGGKLPPTKFATTPRGGVHLYFKMPTDDLIGNRANLLGPRSRIDIRGEGGYVIAPPSMRGDGVAYAWGGELDEAAIATAPAALVDLVMRRGDEPSVQFSISARAAAKVKPPAGKGEPSIATGGEAIRKYGLAALDAELQALRGAREGGRNDALNIAALKLSQLVAAGALHEGFVRAAIEDAAASIGLIKDDGLRAVKATIESGFRAGRKQPRDLDEIRRAAAGRRHKPPAPPIGVEGKPNSHSGAASKFSSAGGKGDKPQSPRPEEPDERNMRLAFFTLTDLGNAERFCERYRDRLMWCASLGWLAWDAKRWTREGAEDLVKRAEHVTVRAIQDEAAVVKGSGRKDVPEAAPGARDYVIEVRRDGTEVLFSEKLAKWGRSSEAVNKLGALSKLSTPYFAVGIEQLDADKMKINVNNGTLVVARKSDGEDYISFHRHDPADLITKISPVDYDPVATCPEYDKFLARVQPSDAMRLFLHQWLGLSLTGDVSEQKLAYLYGNGSNGKSVLMDAVSYIAGDYGETVPIETFLDHGKSRSGGQATPDLALLPGVRMLRTSEPEKNSKLAEATVKLVTGGEPIQARHLNRDFFKFYPQFKLTISGNHRPKISGADDGIWRRFRLVPFTVVIKKEERDLRLSEKLAAEASGILNRLLDGLRHWCDKGLIEPDAVTDATAEYRSVSDPLSRFLSTCIEASPGERVQSSALFAVYEAWCRSAGEPAWKQKGFSLAMDERGFKRKHSDVTWFLDIKLVRGVYDFADSGGQPAQDDKPEAADAGETEL